jgi:hypothetical protein
MADTLFMFSVRCKGNTIELLDAEYLFGGKLVTPVMRTTTIQTGAERNVVTELARRESRSTPPKRGKQQKKDNGERKWSYTHAIMVGDNDCRRKLQNNQSNGISIRWFEAKSAWDGYCKYTLTFKLPTLNLKEGETAQQVIGDEVGAMLSGFAGFFADVDGSFDVKVNERVKRVFINFNRESWPNPADVGLARLLLNNQSWEGVTQDAVNVSFKKQM